MKKDQAKEGKETIEAIKVKEASLEVDGGRCWKKIGLRILSVTGELPDDFENYKLHIIQSNVIFMKEKFPETWILPIAVLFAIGAYTVLAIVFYNNDG